MPFDPSLVASASTWPEDDFTAEANRADMEKLELRWASRTSFTYTVMNPDETECLGCVYLFPPDVSFLRESIVAATADVRWEDLDALLYFWVRSSRLDDGLDRRLLDGVRTWLRTDWDIARFAVVTTAALDQQVGVIEDAGLARWFDLSDPDGDGSQVAYG